LKGGSEQRDDLGEHHGDVGTAGHSSHLVKAQSNAVAASDALKESTATEMPSRASCRIRRTGCGRGCRVRSARPRTGRPSTISTLS
jgi:hypothetical protein